MITAIYFAMLAQIALAFLLYLRLGALRRNALIGRETTYAEIALDDTRWPKDARQVSNCVSNQFELPVIFYVLCLMTIETNSASLLTALLAWAFVVLRYGHAYIHITSNYVPRRGMVFILGYFVLIAMAVIIALRLLFPGL
jgi:hypothetical protein